LVILVPLGRVGDPTVRVLMIGYLMALQRWDEAV
jgi:hypothetical protein